MTGLMLCAKVAKSLPGSTRIGPSRHCAETNMSPILRYPDIDFPVKVDMNPAIATFPSGKTYAIAGSTWIQLPTGSTREDLPKWMEWHPPVSQTESIEVKGSKGNTYVVTKNTVTGAVSCSCPGHKYRGKCKHTAAAEWL